MDIFDYHERGLVRVDEQTEELARRVIGAAIEVHRELGPGLPEAVYKKALSHELTLRGIRHECEVPVTVMYKGINVGQGFVDILVDERLVLELKSVEALTDVHRSQTVAYLKILHLKLGLLINFNVNILKNGIKRIINT